MPRRFGFDTVGDFPRESFHEPRPDLPLGLGEVCTLSAIGSQEGEEPTINLDIANRELDYLISTDNRDARRALLEVDKARGFVTWHLVSPLIHKVVSSTIENVRNEGILDFVASEREHLQDNASQYNNMGYQPNQDADVMIGFLQHPFADFCRDKVSRVSHTLSDRQLTTLHRFYSFPKSWDIDFFMLLAGRTVLDNTEEIEARHPELGLDNVENMAAFLRAPETPSIFRGMASGANGFPDSLRGQNNDPAGRPWRIDPDRNYLLPTRSGSLRLDPEIRRAARQHRIDNAKRKVANWPNTGLQDVAARYSNGCPARKLSFDVNYTVVQSLGIALNEQQQELLTAGPDPIATIEPTTPKGTRPGRIKRDAVKTMCLLVADMLEVASL